jgi:hypothetical protein
MMIIPAASDRYSRTLLREASLKFSVIGPVAAGREVAIVAAGAVVVIGEASAGAVAGKVVGNVVAVAETSSGMVVGAVVADSAAGSVAGEVVASDGNVVGAVVAPDPDAGAVVCARQMLSDSRQIAVPTAPATIRPLLPNDVLFVAFMIQSFLC